MSFRISVQKRNGNITWGVIREEWHEGRRKDRRIPKDQMLAHGFRADMSIEDAKGRARQLNTQSSLAKQEQRAKERALAHAKRIERIKCAYLPETDCADFELQVLTKRFARNDPHSPRLKKAMSHWAYVQRMISALTDKGAARDPSLWADEAVDFYNYIAERRTSPRYVAKLLRVLNLWGHFYCRRHGLAFLPVASPRGGDRDHIEDSYYKVKRGTDSDPVTPEMLEAAKSKFTVPGQYEWMFVACWLGLRPSEVDKLKDTSRWEVYFDEAAGLDVLRIYQGKLVNTPRKKRHKHIPIGFEEQKQAIAYIRAGGLKRPLVKTLRKIFPGHVGVYGPRKGAYDNFVDKGQEPMEVSKWLGHASPTTTYSHYMRKDVVRFKKPKTAA